MSELGCTNTSSNVRFCSLAPSVFIHFASDVFPISIGFVMSNQIGKHNVDKTNVARFFVQGKASNNMPARMTVVTFASFSGTDGALDFKTCECAIIICLAYQ